jgi:3-oxoacyl-[acyl-carrier protein] reductase/meso-butanediol dehydrogenase/(S,S)-butanediol dehydrogenase/diacetyl reductase
MTTSLEGKVAIVTGAGRKRGIGRAIAVRLAQEGAAVAATAVARSPESFRDHEREVGWQGIPSVVAEIEAAGGKALGLDLDVRIPDGVRDAVQHVRKHFGRIDILVNNAGLAIVSGKKNLWEMDDDEWLREIDVNLHGVYHCCRAVIPVLLEQNEGGSIINMSSLAGREGQAQYGGYTPAKFAVVGLTQMLAKELAPYKITVNAVCPGSTDTDMMDGTFNRTETRMGLPQGAIKQMVRTFIPLGRQAKPSEMAGIVAYLASPAASYITGQSISVDGGILMR